ncbi:S-layer homology domain-containing protein [Paenibacillus qinlingensis]|uniref:SLH domain-containing protein n=1 Tax=Paenibacillus qinlingensis TaxID=1837343 RepID=A0ABU1P560_9BACL|nr:S-layer homology domain-containing protein [Paenibacillus qinlingensis]MDR6554863.1 hypothetical protein [Paenibacillus qinlingensis]
MSKIMFLSLAILLLIPGGWLVQAAESASSTRFLLSVSSTDVKVGDVISIEIQGRQLTDLYAYEAIVEFDAAKLAYKSESSLRQGISGAPILKNGEVIVANTFVGNKLGSTGDTAIHRVTFEARATGQTVVKLKSVSMMNSTVNGVITKWSEGSQIAVTVGNGVSAPPSNSTPPSSNLPIISKNGDLTLPVGKAGEVSLNDQVTITIPADASAKDLKVTIDKVLDTQKLLTGNEVLASPIFEILKNFSENFSKPITLTFAFDKNSLKADQKAAVFYFDEVKKVWVEVPGGKVNGNQITVEVNHFTKYAVFAVNPNAVVPEKPLFDTISNLSDIAGHWAEIDIRATLQSGIVHGYEDGTFRPNQFVSRAEFVVMLTNALHPNAGPEKLPNYTDAAVIGDWAKQAIALAAKGNLVQGYEDGSFRPAEQLTRAQLAVVLANALGVAAVESSGSAVFADASDIPAWALDAVGIVAKAGLMKGYEANRFGPLQTVTRAEAIMVINRLLQMQQQK